MNLQAAIFTLLPLLTLLLILWRITRSYAAVRFSTLRQAWCWSVIAASSALLATLVSFEPFSIPKEWGERTWFLSFVLATVPGISILGARKSIGAAWNWFILVPLCFVLFLPAIDRTGPMRQIDLEWPRFFGHIFILLMGTGNYFGTRHTSKSMFFFISVAGLGLTFTPAIDSISSVDPQTLRAMCVLFIFPLVFPFRISPPGRNLTKTPEELWKEFCDSYGIVWAKRVMDRVNLSATEEGWQFRLDLGGIVLFQKNSDAKKSEQSRKRLREILCWQFKRFYDEEWLSQRFDLSEGITTTPEPPDKLL